MPKSDRDDLLLTWLKDDLAKDIEHIRKMYDMCREGGQVISISSKSWTFNTGRKFEEFRQWLDEVDAYTEEIEEGAFKASGTNIQTMLIVINK